MAQTKNWFEVDRKGLKQLQEGKSKTFVVRELLQNAFDEDITSCVLHMCYEGRGKVTIAVEDDSPTGFRDLSDAYTLFKETSKRSDATKRGRFNLGEKQIFSICNSAEIVTTTGTIIFDEDGRSTSRRKRDKGSIITIQLKMTHEETEECYQYAKNLLIPQGIEFTIHYCIPNADVEEIFVGEYLPPYKRFEATLKTELNQDGQFRPTSRKTQVHLHQREGVKYLYEMGIPVCEIECDYSIDVQQKVPLSADRDAVVPSFLKELYGEVLNHTFEELPRESASNLWVREATTSSRVMASAVQTVITKRFGEHVVVANTKDPNSIDEAISKGYKVIYGSELSKEEWNNVKALAPISSTTDKFGTLKVGFTTVSPTDTQKAVGEWCKKAYREIFGDTLKVHYISAPSASTIADFGEDTLRFNIPRMNFIWEVGGIVSPTMLDLIIHEFGHKKGHHTEHPYHDALTMMGSWFTMKALVDPEWFKIYR